MRERSWNREEYLDKDLWNSRSNIYICCNGLIQRVSNRYCIGYRLDELLYPPSWLIRDRFRPQNSKGHNSRRHPILASHSLPVSIMVVYKGQIIHIKAKDGDKKKVEQTKGLCFCMGLLRPFGPNLSVTPMMTHGCRQPNHLWFIALQHYTWNTLCLTLPLEMDPPTILVDQHLHAGIIKKERHNK